MKRIYTVQHTQSEHHTNGMVGSWTDWNLTVLGKQQAFPFVRFVIIIINHQIVRRSIGGYR